MKKFFSILGMDETRDADAIKAAYRKQLVKVNPEDDPEGFKQLRAAYQSAMEYAQSEDETAGRKDDTPSGKWMEKAAHIYGYMSERINPAAWEALFDSPVFMDLDEEENCREKMFHFLAEHFRLPSKIWKILDRELLITEHRQELYESYPKDFVDYICTKCKQEDNFEFDLFEGPDDGPYDDYFNFYNDILKAKEDKNQDAICRGVQQAESLGIYHPYMELVKAQLAAQSDLKEAEKILISVLAKYPHRDSIRYPAAEIYWNGGWKEKAVELYLAMKKDLDNHYMSNRRLAEWYDSQKEFQKAKECGMVLLKYALDDEAKQLIQHINSGLEEKMKREVEEQPDNFKVRMELGWCYLQDEENNKGIALMDFHEPPANMEKEYVNLMSKLTFSSHDYDRAEKFLRRWLELLWKEMPEEEKARRDDWNRVTIAHAMLSQIARERGESAASTEEKQSFYEQSLREIDEAIRYSNEPGMLHTKAVIYMEMEQYDRVLFICDKLLEEIPQYAPAMILKQKACAEMRDAAGVLGAYHLIRRIFPTYTENYEMVIQVYWDLQRLDELKQILKDAGENGVTSQKLELYSFRLKNAEARDRQELTKFLEEEAGKEEEHSLWSPEMRAELYCERARGHWRLKEHAKALEFIGKAIELNENESQYRYIKAGILKDLGKNEEALELYFACERDYDQTSHYYSNIADCYRQMEKYTDALEWYQKSLDIYEDDPYCNDMIVEIYTDFLRRKENLYYLEAALPYANHLIAISPNAYNYIERGLLYLEGRKLEEALVDFKKAIELEPENQFAHNNAASTYRYMGNLEKAQEEAELAVKYMDLEPNAYPYRNLAEIYEQRKEYEKAFDCYRAMGERFPGNRSSALDGMMRICCNLGRYEDAFHAVQEVLKGNDIGRCRKMAELYCQKEQYKEALDEAKKIPTMKGGSIGEMYSLTAEIYWHAGKLKRALHYIKRAVSEAEKNSYFYREYCRKAADYYFYSGKKQKAAEYARKVMETYEKLGDMDKELSSVYYRPVNYCNLAMTYYYLGKEDEAEAYLSAAEEMLACRHCHYSYCTDAVEMRAAILYDKGKKTEAVKLLQEILEEAPSEMDVRVKLRLMQTQDNS